MGIHVHLSVVPDRIDVPTWQQLYEDARRIAREWTPRPLGITLRHIGRERVGQYSTDLEHADGLYIVGDAESLMTGESFVFPARLPSPWTHEAVSTECDDDILPAVVAHTDDALAPRLHFCELFGHKTQGLPYHTLLVAIGAWVEHRLPRTALVHGDLCRDDAEQAQRRLAQIFGERVELSVFADEERLRLRLAPSFAGTELDRVMRWLAPTSPAFGAIAGELLATMRAAPDARVRDELAQVARTCRDPAQLFTGTRTFLGNVMSAVRTNAARAELVARIEQDGPLCTHEAIARATLRLGVRLTQSAWDSIEAAGTHELALMLALASTDGRGVEIHDAVRALLENAALRELDAHAS